VAVTSRSAGDTVGAGGSVGGGLSEDDGSEGGSSDGGSEGGAEGSDVDVGGGLVSVGSAVATAVTMARPSIAAVSARPSLAVVLFEERTADHPKERATLFVLGVHAVDLLLVA
jgi:hypothetical protein